MYLISAHSPVLLTNYARRKLDSNELQNTSRPTTRSRRNYQAAVFSHRTANLQISTSQRAPQNMNLEQCIHKRIQPISGTTVPTIWPNLRNAVNMESVIFGQYLIILQRMERLNVLSKCLNVLFVQILILPRTVLLLSQQAHSTQSPKFIVIFKDIVQLPTLLSNGHHQNYFSVEQFRTTLDLIRPHVQRQVSGSQLRLVRTNDRTVSDLFLTRVRKYLLDSI